MKKRKILHSSFRFLFCSILGFTLTATLICPTLISCNQNKSGDFDPTKPQLDEQTADQITVVYTKKTDEGYSYNIVAKDLTKVVTGIKTFHIANYQLTAGVDYTYSAPQFKVVDKSINAYEYLVLTVKENVFNEHKGVYKINPILNDKSTSSFMITGSHNIDVDNKETFKFKAVDKTTFTTVDVNWYVTGNGVISITQDGVITPNKKEGGSASIIATNKESNSIYEIFEVEVGSFSKIDFTNPSAIVAKGSEEERTKYSGTLIIPSRYYQEGFYFLNVTGIKSGIVGDNSGFQSCGFDTIIFPSSITCIPQASFSNCTQLTTFTINPDISNEYHLKSIDANAFSFCSRLFKFYIPSSVITLGDNAFDTCNYLNEVDVDSIAICDLIEDSSKLLNNATTVCVKGDIHVSSSSFIAKKYVYFREIENYHVYKLAGSISISDKSTHQTSFEVGNTFSSDGIVLWLIDESGTFTKEITTGFSTDFDEHKFETNDLGKQIVTVTYEGHTTTYRIDVEKSDIIIESSRNIDVNNTDGYPISAYDSSKNLLSDVTYKCEPERIIEISGGRIKLDQGRLKHGTVTITASKEGYNSSTFEVEVASFKYIDFTDFNAIKANNELKTAAEESVNLLIPSRYYDDKIKSWKKITGIYSSDSETDGAFYGCNSIYSVSFPSSIKHISKNAFRNCKKLKSIEMPDEESLLTFGDYCFYSCTELYRTKIPNTVVSIGLQAFDGCTSLTEVTSDIENSQLTTIKDYAFRNTKITSFNIPKGVTDDGFGQGVFINCSQLAMVTIDNSKITKIPPHCFENCIGLTQITIPSSVVSVEAYAFAGCSSLTAINLPGKFELLCEHCFDGCLSLQTIYYSSDIKLINIPDYAFYNCKALMTFDHLEKITYIGKSAFAYSGITSVTIREDMPVSGVGEEAFRGCANLTTVIVNSKTYAESNDPGWLFRLVSGGDRPKVVKVPKGSNVEKSSLSDWRYGQPTQEGDYDVYTCKVD